MKIIKDIEQGSQEWLEARAWTLTWTKLKWAVSARKGTAETLIYELIWEEFAPLLSNFASEAMQRWTDLEEEAKFMYQSITEEKVEEVWFIQSTKYVDKFGSWLWLSPDWIIEKDWKYKKAIEIKCPLGKNFIKYYIENKIPDEYKYQILTYFLVIEDLEELDFIIYNPDFHLQNKRLKIITITREELKEELQQVELKLYEFRAIWIENIKKILY